MYVIHLASVCLGEWVFLHGVCFCTVCVSARHYGLHGRISRIAGQHLKIVERERSSCRIVPEPHVCVCFIQVCACMSVEGFILDFTCALFFLTFLFLISVLAKKRKNKTASILFETHANFSFYSNEHISAFINVTTSFFR